MSIKKLGLVALAPLACLAAAPAGHLVVFGPDGVSVGHYLNSSRVSPPQEVSNSPLPSTGSAIESPVPEPIHVEPHVPAPVVQLEEPISVTNIAPPQQPAQSPAMSSQVVVQPSGQPGVPISQPIANAVPSTVPSDAPVADQISSYRPEKAPPGPDPAHPFGFWFINNNAMPHHISADWAQKDRQRYGNHPFLSFNTHVLEPGASYFIEGLPGVSPKFYVGISDNNRTAEVGADRDHDTLVEATLRGGYGWTYFDIDIERGFSSPVWCHGQGDKWTDGQGCTTDVLAVCPQEHKHYNAQGLLDQCRGTPAKESVDFRRKHCPITYVEWNDDERTKATSGAHVLICTIIPTPQTSSINAAQLEKIQKKKDSGLPPDVVLPRRNVLSRRSPFASIFSNQA